MKIIYRWSLGLITDRILEINRFNTFFFFSKNFTKFPLIKFKSSQKIVIAIENDLKRIVLEIIEHD